MSHFSLNIGREHGTAHAHVEILERNPVVGVGSLQDGLENDKVVPRDEPSFCAVRDTEERRKLGTSYFGQI